MFLGFAMTWWDLRQLPVCPLSALPLEVNTPPYPWGYRSWLGQTRRLWLLRRRQVCEFYNFSCVLQNQDPRDLLRSTLQWWLLQMNLYSWFHVWWLWLNTFKSCPKIVKVIWMFTVIVLYDFNNYLFNNMLLYGLICLNFTFYLFGLQFSLS